MKKETVKLPALGGSSLLVVFAVLCLTVLALLSFSTAQAENRMARASAEAVSAWYAADLEAERIFARLRAGEPVPQAEQDGDIFRYSVPVSLYQTLYVDLFRRQDSWQVLRWQAVAHPEAPSETLPVWNGEGSP